MPLLTSHEATPWRTATLTENLGNARPGDPDYEPFQSPPFHALRSRDWLYVEYRNHDRELYDEITDPDEMHNIYTLVSPQVRQALHVQLRRLATCAGVQCRIADSMPTPTPVDLATTAALPIATPSP